MHLGEDLNHEQFSVAMDTLAEYVYLNLATPAAASFDQLRRVSDNMAQLADQASLRTFALAPFSRQEGESISLPRWLADATPRLAHCARWRRTLITVPRREGIDQLIHDIERELGSAVTTIEGCGNEVNICCEMESLSLPHILHTLTRGNEEYARVASRILSRSDIEWMPLEL